MPMLLSPDDGACGAGADGGRRPTVVPAPHAPSSELSDRPQRRRFTVADKLRVLAATDDAAGTGEIGAILRREGLYSSTLTDWRRQREAGTLHALTPVKRGPKTMPVNPLAEKLADLERENARLTRQLARAEAIIDLQKKVASLLGDPPIPSDDAP